MLRQPGNGRFNCFRDICAVWRNDSLPAQPIVEVHMFRLCDGVFQVVIPSF